jgi:hypothetical protein
MKVNGRRPEKIPQLKWGMKGCNLSLKKRIIRKKGYVAHGDGV